MKRITLFIALSFHFCVTQAQYSNISFYKTTPVFDTNLITHNPIVADCYSFPYPIEYVKYDSATETMLLVLAGRASINLSPAPGTIALLDLQKHNVRWTEDEDLSSSWFSITEHAVIEFNSKELIGQSLDDGHVLWRRRSEPLLYSLENEIAFMPVCEKKICSDSLFEAISLIDGKPLWKIEIDSKHSLLPSHKINDSIWIINGQGIIAVNKYKGEMWRFSSITDLPPTSGLNKMDYVDQFSVVPVSFDKYVKEPGFNVRSGFHSSVLHDSLSVYYATKDKLVSINFLSGTTDWEAPLNEYFTSYSTLLDADSIIIMVNSGMAFIHGFKGNEYIQGTIHYGKPHISAYRKTDGKQMYMNIIDERDAVLIDQKFMHDTLVILLKNGINMYYVQNGNLINSIRMGTENTDGFKILSDKSIYFEKDKKIVRVQDYYPQDLLVRSNNDMIFIFDKGLKYKGYIVPNKQYFEVTSNEGFKVLKKYPAESEKVEKFLFTSDNQTVCPIYDNNFSMINDNKLFVYAQNNLYIIDLELLK